MAPSMVPGMINAIKAKERCNQATTLQVSLSKFTSKAQYQHRKEPLLLYLQHPRWPDINQHLPYITLMKVQDTLDIEPQSRCRNCIPSGPHAQLLVGLQISGLRKDGSIYKCSFSDGAQSIEGFFGSKVSLSTAVTQHGF